jgi:CheY-like chemotaxis protein
MSRLFSAWQVETISFLDADEALEWIDLVDQGFEVGELPTLAILDLRFYGDIRGQEIGQRIRQSPHLKDIPIVITTGYLDPEIENMVREACDPDLYLAKGKYTPEQMRGFFTDAIINRRKTVKKRQAALRRQRKRDSGDN